MTISTAAAGWSLAGTVAGSTGPGSTATLDLTVPSAGLAPGGVDADLRLLGIDLRRPCPPVDQWIRGTDLIAVYEPEDARRLRATALWRPRGAEAGVTAWELVLSAQTALVQSDSAIAVVSQAPAGEAAWGEPVRDGWRWTAAAAGTPRPTSATCLLLRGGREPGPARSLLVAVHPDDVRQIDIDREAGLARVRCWLFSTAIEKGQLFRGRVLAAVGPRQDDEAWASRLASEFAAAPPPLTT
jgi:hypothetical protein